MLRISILFLIFLIFACSQNNEQVQKVEQVEDLTGDTITNDYAEAFRIINFPDHQQIDIIEPSSNEVLYRYGFGEKVPVTLVDLGSRIETIAALSSTHVGMLKKLDLQDHILGVSSKKYSCNQDLSSDWINYGDLGQSDPEMFVRYRPSLVMYSGFKLDHPILKKLKKIEIPAMVNYDWKETHPLGRAEWLKVFGILFNVEDRAAKKFDQIKRRYRNLTKDIQKDSTRPSVVVGTVYGDVFNVPAGESYMAKMLEDANVNYKYKNTEGTASLSISLEEFITTNRSTDYWLNAAASSKKEVLNMNANFGMMKAFQEGEMYTYFDRVNCFWEESAVAPEKVLSDLIHIFHPDKFEDQTLYYYKRISTTQ